MRRQWSALLLTAAACARPAMPEPAVTVSLDTLAMRVHTRFLSRDALRGRATGDPMTRAAARYIAEQCRALGLAPVADRWLTPVPLVDARLDAGSTVRVSGGDTAAFRFGRDFLVIGGTPAQLGEPIHGAAVWLGAADQPVDAPRSLAGAVPVLAGLPQPEAVGALADRGARGVLALMGDEALARLAGGYTAPLRLSEPAVSSYFPPLPVVLGGTRLAEAVIAVARGATRQVAITLEPRPVRVEAVNVGCRLPGRDARARDTAIAYTAHYDHLGLGTPVGGDSIYNGFSDNAGGVAMLLALAEALQRPGLAPRHTILFLFFTAEERGLLGSDWWVAHPPWPLERLRAVINLDAGAPPGRVWSWEIAGGTGSPLADLARDVAARHGWTAVLSAARANSDYFPFHRLGVPALFPIPTPAPYEGLTADSSQALRRRWDRYHHPDDEWSADFPFAGLERYAAFALWLGLAIDRR